jgi:hypothetical protein
MYQYLFYLHEYGWKNARTKQRAYLNCRLQGIRRAIRQAGVCSWHLAVWCWRLALPLAGGRCMLVTLLAQHSLRSCCLWVWGGVLGTRQRKGSHNRLHYGSRTGNARHSWMGIADGGRERRQAAAGGSTE